MHRTIGVYGTAFLTGLLVLTVEVFGPRLLQSYYGAGLYVWSATIAVTLLALAVGYYVGGRVADGTPRGGPGMALLAAGGFLVLLAFVRTPILGLFRGIDLRIGILACTAIFFFVPLALLGAVAPILVGLRTHRTGRVGRSVGSVFFVSTLGSVVGALLTGFFLLAWVGTRDLLLICGGAAAALGIAWLVGTRSLGREAVAIVGAAAVAALAGHFATPIELHADQEVLHVTESFYGQIKVAEGELRGLEERPRVRVLFVDGRAQALIGAENGRSYHTFSYDMHLMRVFRPEGGRVLLVGLGSGFLARLFAEDGLEVDVVEIDPAVHDVAKRFFGYDDAAPRVHIADGRYFVETTPERYDFVVFNAFQGDRLPVHMHTREMLQSVRRVLRPGGILVNNLYAPLESPGDIAARSFFCTLKSAFRHTRVFTRDAGRPVAETFFFSSDAPLKERWEPSLRSRRFGRRLEARLRQLAGEHEVRVDPAGGVLLTDEFNPLDVWLLEGSAAWMQREVENWGVGLLLADS